MVSRFGNVRFMVCIAPGWGAAVGGSLRSSLSGSRPTSHSQMPAPSKPSRENVLSGTIAPLYHIPSQIKRLSGTKYSVLNSRLLSFPRKARQSYNYPDSPFALRIRALQKAPFADFAAEDLVERGHGRAGGGLEEIG